MSFAEIMLTVFIVFVLALPLLYVTTSSRKETTHAINYLRAVELANEVIDWTNGLRFEQINSKTFMDSGLCESLTDLGNNSKCKPIEVTNKPANKTWKDDNFFASKISYPEQYAGYYFYRDVKVEPDDNSSDLKTITVTVTWAEAYAPKRLDDGKDRNKTVILSTIVMRDRNYILKLE